jgi:hypothetical protein
MLKCFDHQTYPKDRMEWIIIDDGTDKIEDLVSHIPQVKYYKYDEKMTLGKKRNLMHEKTSGEIIIYMDDDDYYPPERVSHAVTKLLENPNILVAGSSKMYIYFKHINKMYSFGPYLPNHATAATFAFRKELLKQTKYDDEAELAEEKSFLKNYTIPFVQLNSLKSILVFSHNHNSFDKKLLLNQPSNPFVQESNVKVADFVKDENMMKFFLEDIDEMLENYSPGKPENKPNVLKQIEEIKQHKEEITLIHQLQQSISVYEQRLAQITHENIKLTEKNEYLQKKITGLIQEKISFLKEQKEKEQKEEEEKGENSRDPTL